MVGLGRKAECQVAERNRRHRRQPRRLTGGVPTRPVQTPSKLRHGWKTGRVSHGKSSRVPGFGLITERMTASLFGNARLRACHVTRTY